MVEALDNAVRRGARIYAEILGGAVNCGGQRQGGSITASNQEGVRRCIREAVRQAGVNIDGIDYINGHLTATGGDAKEIGNLLCGLQLPPEKFPLINSTKSMIGHTLGAAGAIEGVATVCQLHEGFVHASLNCEDVHPALGAIAGSIPHKTVLRRVRVALKTSFGFGDVNACAVFSRWGGE